MDDRLQVEPLHGAAELGAWCARLGIELPPIPAQFGATLRRVSPHAFATREMRWSPYSIDDWVAEEGAPEYLLIGHAGHGVNSYAVSYFLVQQHLRLFLQVGLGGIYMDAERARRAVCDGFSAAARLIRAARAAPMLIIASEFYGSRWSAGSSGAFQESPTVLECLRRATAWLEAQR